MSQPVTESTDYPAGEAALPDGLTRRQFLRRAGVSSGALVIAFNLPLGRQAGAAEAAQRMQPNAYVAIDLDGTVTLVNDKSEIGQGISDGYVNVLAEEIGADLAKVRMAPIPTDPSSWGSRMSVSGSRSMRGAWSSLRTAGAQARSLLVQAAASRAGASADSLYTEAGFVRSRSGDLAIPFSELVADAALLQPPENPTLKDPSEFTIIGKQDARMRIRDQVTGKAVYGMDVQPEGLLYATIERSPVFGGSLKSYDDSSARQVPGFVRTLVVEPNSRAGVHAGVAVVAESYYAAAKARAALRVQWDAGANANLDSDQVLEELKQISTRPLEDPEVHGDFDAAYSSAARQLDATYSSPFLHHMTMEPMNCTAHVRADSCEVWAPTQGQGGVQGTAASLTGLEESSITVHTPHIGGGFGRRLKGDFAYEALYVAREFDRPVKLIWTREDDVRYGGYRPMSVLRGQAGLDAQGRVQAISMTLATQDRFGAPHIYYDVPNVRVGKNSASNDIPTGAWRGIHHNHSAFYLESMMDELAHLAGQDPLQFRLNHLADDSPYAAVLREVADKSDWGSPLPAGRARGVALGGELAGTFVAQVVEASIEDGKPVVHRVVCAVDCGIAVSPGSVKAQAEGSILYGLTAALYGEINIRNGGVVQSNFHDYMPLRMNESPEIEIHIMPSERDPGGMGEPGVPPLMPALTGAIYALTGERVRDMPIRLNRA